MCISDNIQQKCIKSKRGVDNFSKDAEHVPVYAKWLDVVQSVTNKLMQNMLAQTCGDLLYFITNL